MPTAKPRRDCASFRGCFPVTLICADVTNCSSLGAYLYKEWILRGNDLSFAKGNSEAILIKYCQINQFLSEIHEKLDFKTVSPHHSGIYPVHEELYEAWKKVWNIKVSSTEEYPHLRPSWKRRGFIHRDIKVLPRQTCGLFTHTILEDNYPGGRKQLDKNIHGGELFRTFIFNVIMIFMTHMSNYGNDRLALYTFETVVKFIQTWTNLKLMSIPPVELAQLYFTMYPQEKNPIWTNPCDDKRHKKIWSKKKSCYKLPDLIIIGPQKTGTTALFTFLSIHPSLIPSYRSNSTYEEVQYFHNANYNEGMDWYIRYFPEKKDKNFILFEKSANYFDSERAPNRIHALLPRCKLIAILINPVERAYSWYQQQKSKNNEAAREYSFYDVVTANNTAPENLQLLKRRCINPGLYIKHLKQWLSYYSPSQLMILDGDLLTLNPILTMKNVQVFLNATPQLDYSSKIKYNHKKGFYCKVLNNNMSKCLGGSKGRHYAPMESKAASYLTDYYRKYNLALTELLLTFKKQLPTWLAQELKSIH